MTETVNYKALVPKVGIGGVPLDGYICAVVSTNVGMLYKVITINKPIVGIKKPINYKDSLLKI